METNRRNNIYLYVLKVTFIASIIYFLYAKFGLNADSDISWKQINFFAIAGAFFLAIIHTYGVFLAWHILLVFSDIKIPQRSSFEIYIYSLLARYLPGGVWHIGGRIVALKNKGYRLGSISFALLVEQLMSLSVCVFLGLIFYLYRPINLSRILPDNLGINLWFYTLPILALLLITSYVVPIFNKSLSILKIDRHKHIKLGGGDLLVVYVCHVLSVLVFALVYYCAVLAFSENQNIEMSTVIAAVLISTVFGYLVPFVPGGLGVREGAIILILSGDVDSHTLYWASITARLLLIGAELALWACTLTPNKSNTTNA